MCGRLALLVCLLVLVARPLGAEMRSPLTVLSEGGHFAMVRHALAPGGGDPKEFTLGDCSTQRNLNDVGRAQARRIGDAFRLAGIRAWLVEQPLDRPTILVTHYTVISGLAGVALRPGEIVILRRDGNGRFPVVATVAVE